MTYSITIVAAQDQAISTNYFKNKILKEETESKCRLCEQHEETIDNLTSGCPVLAKNEYLMIHDKVCSHLHYSICKALGTETTDKLYTHTHAQTSVSKGRCHSVVESSSTHRQRSYSK